MSRIGRACNGWLALCLAGMLAAAMPSPAQAVTLTDGDRYGPWRVVFAGYGEVVATSNSRLRLRPAIATAPEQTHAALAVTDATYSSTRIKARVTLNQQLRTGSAPNPWETGWLITRYQDPEHFYYLALKTNGWELGKRDPAYPGGQRFLATGPAPTAREGQSQVAVLIAKGSKLTVRINGNTVTSFSDAETAYTTGSAGVYTEDADVTFDQIAVTS
ncbi:MAG: hypothetical protein MUF33_11950 [Candidatus Nanopelagicales bacterium]|nr:hypothetical protein [Candidatus Nanopelagicales bacterium]